MLERICIFILILIVLMGIRIKWVNHCYAKLSASIMVYDIYLLDNSDDDVKYVIEQQLGKNSLKVPEKVLWDLFCWSYSSFMTNKEDYEKIRPYI